MNEIKLALDCCNNIAVPISSISNIEHFNDLQWDTSGFMGIYEDSAIITFRESDSYIDWRKVNFRFCQKIVPYNNTNPKIKVHTGFISAYKAVRDTILKYICESTKTKIWCFGFSLGAAMASLAALDIQYNFQYNPTVITFGCPRIGNKAFMRSYNSRVPNTIRVVNGNDLVTKVPPPCMLYSHVGQEQHIGSPKKWWNIWDIDSHNLTKYRKNIR